MKRIKVAYICTPIDFGGAEKVSLNFLKEVDRECFDIIPILLIRPWEPPPYLAQQLKALNYSCLELPVSLTPRGGPWRVFRVAWNVYKILRQGQFDLVHTHGYFADICTMLCARLVGVKSVATCHGFVRNDKKLCWYNYLDKQFLKLSSAIISVSEGIKEELLRAGISEKIIHVIPNGVPAGPDALRSKQLRQATRFTLKLSPDEFAIGYLGRLSEEKGVKYLVEAVARLIDEGVSAKLLLVGDGPSRGGLEELSNTRLGVGNAIFTGFQENAEQWLPAMDVFALPSLSEGTPMALLEAMAARIPVVASAVGGVPQIIRDGEGGLLVSAEDSVELAAALARLATNHFLCQQLAENAAQVVGDKYGLNGWRKKYEEIYEKIVLA